MAGESGFRTGLLIGILSAAVVALGAGVIVLLASGDGGDSTTIVSTQTTTSTAQSNQDTSSEPTIPAPTGCPDVPDIGPTGADPADAVNVTVVAVDCDLAARVARSFYPTAIGGNADPADGVAVLGFGCTESQTASGVVSVECVQNVGRIRFELG